MHHGPILVDDALLAVAHRADLAAGVALDAAAQLGLSSRPSAPRASSSGTPRARRSAASAVASVRRPTPGRSRRRRAAACARRTTAHFGSRGSPTPSQAMPITTICARSICDSFSSTTSARSSQPLTTDRRLAQRRDFLARAGTWSGWRSSWSFQTSWSTSSGRVMKTGMTRPSGVGLAVADHDLDRARPASSRRQVWRSSSCMASAHRLANLAGRPCTGPSCRVFSVISVIDLLPLLAFGGGDPGEVDAVACRCPACRAARGRASSGAGRGSCRPCSGSRPDGSRRPARRRRPSRRP